MKVIIVDELHDIKKSGVYYSTEALKKVFQENDIECQIVGMRKRGRLFNKFVCLPFFRELFILPLWNKHLSIRLSSLSSNDVVFYQCSTSLLLLKKTRFKKVVYTRALLSRQLATYKSLKMAFTQKLVVYALYKPVSLWERRSFGHADRIVASKELFRDYLNKTMHIPLSRIVVIPQMIDIVPAKNTTHKKEYDLLYIGRLSIPKNWPLVEELALQSTYKIAAATPELNDTTNVTKNIKVFHQLDQHALNELINSSKIFIMPSHNETGPRVTLEAMAQGLPVVTSIDGGGGFVDDGVNGFIIEDGKIETYITKIDLLLNDPALMSKMSKINKPVAARYSTQKLGKKYVQAMLF